MKNPNSHTSTLQARSSLSEGNYLEMLMTYFERFLLRHWRQGRLGTGLSHLSYKPLLVTKASETILDSRVWIPNSSTLEPKSNRSSVPVSSLPWKRESSPFSICPIFYLSATFYPSNLSIQSSKLTCIPEKWAWCKDLCIRRWVMQPVCKQVQMYSNCIWSAFGKHLFISKKASVTLHSPYRCADL